MKPSRMATQDELDELKDFIFVPPSEIVEWELDSDNTYTDEDFEDD